MLSDYEKISLITVTFNSESTLCDAIESVLAQSYPNIEYILVDGASKDNAIVMPAHPTFFTYRKHFEEFGYYKTDYRIAADYA